VVALTKFVLEQKIALAPLDKNIMPLNIDGTKNKSGVIRHCTWLNLKIGKRNIPTRFLVTDLGKEEIILGLPWLKEHNSQINWLEGTMNIETIRPVTTFGKVMRRTIELSRMFTPSPKPILEEIFDNYDHLPANPLFLTMMKSSEVYMRMMMKKKPTYDMSEATLKRMTFLKKNKKEFGLEPKRPYHKDWPMTQRQRRQRLNYSRNMKNTKQSLKRKPLSAFL